MLFDKNGTTPDVLRMGNAFFFQSARYADSNPRWYFIDPDWGVLAAVTLVPLFLQEKDS